MIVPMKKCLVAMLESEKREGLRELRRLGTLHVESVEGVGEAYEGAKAERELLERAVSALSSRKPPKTGIPRTKEHPGALAAARRLEELASEEKALMERTAFLTKECDRLSVWGDFSPESIAALEACGRTVRLHALPDKPAPVFPEGSEALRLGGKKGSSFYLSFADPGISSMPEALILPDKGLSHMKAEIASLRERAGAIEAERDNLATALPDMKAALGDAKRALAFETLRSGMGADGEIAFLSGWIPAPDLPALQATAAKRGWALADDDPADEEQPPTKVRNGPLVRIIQPVFDFLGTVPNYREYEISAWFMLFFCVFFAMIFGDGGYGLLMLAADLAIILSAAFKRKKVPDAVFLLGLLSLATITWGALTGSWFSLPPEKLPGFLRGLALEWIAGWNPESGDNVKVLCFLIGGAQLSIAHLKNILRDIRSLKFLGQLGSLALVIGMLFLVFNLVIDPGRFPLPDWALYAIGGGFALNFIFSNYEGNILKSVLAGFKNIIPTFLGTVSVFADIVSYIRLWAVGLAGVAISQTVNGMGGGLFVFGGALYKALIGAVFGVIILGFGHSLNIVMSVLSVVVHGVRLNMLEFSGHLGMEWSGYKYDPFRE